MSKGSGCLTIVFAGVAAAGLAIFGLLVGKGMITGVIPDDDQEGIDYVGRVTEDVADDIDSIARAIFRKGGEKTPDEVKESARAISETVKSVREEMDRRNEERDFLNNVDATINDDLTND